MIKNKVLNIKTNFKNIKNKLRIFQIPEQMFIVQNIKQQFSKIIFKNKILKLLLKTIIKHVKHSPHSKHNPYLYYYFN